jgi:7-carboxy-7-deazaguanine synthase
MMRDAVRLSTDGIFYTVQGEGPLAGVPSLFVRLDTCNLKCKWGDTICDAHYTSWTPSGPTIPLDEFDAMVLKELDRTQCRHMVITGGEPAMQPGVVRLLAKRMAQRGGHSTIETNGTRFIEDHYLSMICLSPKLRGSTPVGTQFEKVHERNRWQPLEIRQWIASAPYYFKFVINTEADIAEVCGLLDGIDHPLESEHVLFMPQGIDRNELWERGRWLAERCKALGVRFTPRIQIDLYGNKPGT